MSAGEHDEHMISLDDALRRFQEMLLMNPSEIICKEEVKCVLAKLRAEVITITPRRSDNCRLISVVDSDELVDFYLKYVQLVSNSESDHLTNPVNRTVSNFIKIQTILWNVSNSSGSLCCRLLSRGAPSLLFRLLSDPHLEPLHFITKKNCRLLVHSSIGILYNLLYYVPNERSLYRELGAVKLLMDMYNSDFDKATADPDLLSCWISVLILLAFLVDEDENKRLHAIDRHIEYILNALEDALNSRTLYSNLYGFCVMELLNGLYNLAVHDDNKKILIDKQALNYIDKALKIAVEMEKATNSASRTVQPGISSDTLAARALHFLWSLAFLPDFKSYLVPGTPFRRLVEHFTGDFYSRECRLVARSILRTVTKTVADLCADEKSVDELMGEERKKHPKNGHIMISYAHSTKVIMVEVYKELEKRNYDVWIDVNNIYDSFVDHMAEAIESSSAIVLGLCQDFKLSCHCRQEMRYAYELQRQLFALELEPNFVADGWLGLLIAKMPRIHLHNHSSIVQAVDRLVYQLGEIGKHRSSTPAAECDSSVSHPVTVAPDDRRLSSPGPERLLIRPCYRTESEDDAVGTVTVFGQTASPLLSPDYVKAVDSWTAEEVSNWLVEQGLSKYVDCLCTVDGPMLMELARLYVFAPESLSISLRVDLNMQLIDQLRLHRSLAKLFLINRDLSHLPRGTAYCAHDSHRLLDK